MSYEPSSPLASLALPVLSLDNAIALKLLLPRMASPAASPLGTQDPISGPLVAVARSVGILPAREADGWEGEPSACVVRVWPRGEAEAEAAAEAEAEAEGAG